MDTYFLLQDTMKLIIILPYWCLLKIPNGNFCMVSHAVGNSPSDQKGHLDIFRSQNSLKIKPLMHLCQNPLFYAQIESTGELSKYDRCSFDLFLHITNNKELLSNRTISWWGETLTDFIHGDIKSFQFGAFSQEVGRHALHVVLAQIERLDLRQTQRHMQLIYTVTVGETQMSFFFFESQCHNKLI